MCSKTSGDNSRNAAGSRNDDGMHVSMETLKRGLSEVLLRLAVTLKGTEVACWSPVEERCTKVNRFELMVIEFVKRYKYLDLD